MAQLRSGFRQKYTDYFSELPESAEARRDCAAGVKRLLTERSRAPDLSGQATELEKRGIPRQQILVEKQASEARMYGAEISKAPWIHFTTHTAAENPWEQHVGLVLTADPRASKARMEYSPKTRGFRFDRDIDFHSDGFLSPREIETLELSADFVFLQGCQTVTGRLSFSSGLLGLMSAFLTVGLSSRVIGRSERGRRSIETLRNSMPDRRKRRSQSRFR